MVYRRQYYISCDEGEESKERYYQFDFDDPRLHKFPLLRIYPDFDDDDTYITQEFENIINGGEDKKGWGKYIRGESHRKRSYVVTKSMGTD